MKLSMGYEENNCTLPMLLVCPICNDEDFNFEDYYDIGVVFTNRVFCECCGFILKFDKFKDFRIIKEGE